MTLTTKSFGPFVAIALLAACGGGGGGGGDDGPRTVFTNQPLNSEVPGSSSIAAAGLVQDPSSGEAQLVQLFQGDLDRVARTLDVAGLITNGTEIGENTWQRGDNIVGPSDNAALNGLNLNFAVPVDVTVSGGTAGTYLLGVLAREQDLPDTGQAFFDGKATIGTLIDGAGSGASTASEANGDVVITATFSAADTVDVVIDNFSNASLPFDSVQINDLAISAGSGATFQSTPTSTVTFGTSSATDIVGDNDTFDANGAFFGGDSNGPAEAGGGFLLSGDNGDVFGIFAGTGR